VEKAFAVVVSYSVHLEITDMFVCRNHDPVLSSFMTYHWVWYQSNTTGATRGTGTAYPFGTPEFIPVSVGLVLVFLVMFCRSFFCLFWGVTALSVLFRFTAFFYYPFVILKHFLNVVTHRTNNIINTAGTTSGAGTAYPSGAPEFAPGC